MTFTENAITYIKKMLAKQSGSIFRLTIKKTGCSGYSYSPSLQTNINTNDMVYAVTEDLNIYIDTVWLHLLQQVTVDYVEDDKSGLKQKRLVFTNPNEASRCGCGESFHVE